jgi:hypothetical protein
MWFVNTLVLETLDIIVLLISALTNIEGAVRSEAAKDLQEMRKLKILSKK